MAKPARNSIPDQIVSGSRTFFATTKTSQGRPLLQSERNATLMVDVLRSYVAAGKFQLHDFVIMPNHVHLLLTSFLVHRQYIAQNPVKAGMVDSPEKFPYRFTYLARRKAAGAKAPAGLNPAARLKPCPDTESTIGQVNRGAAERPIVEIPVTAREACPSIR